MSGAWPNFLPALPLGLYGVAVALSRLNQLLRGMPPCWPETDRLWRKRELATAGGRAVVEVRGRCAIGMAVVRNEAPMLHALVLFGARCSTWQTLSGRLLQAAGVVSGAKVRTWGPHRREGGSLVYVLSSLVKRR